GGDETGPGKGVMGIDRENPDAAIAVVTQLGLEFEVGVMGAAEPDEHGPDVAVLAVDNLTAIAERGIGGEPVQDRLGGRQGQQMAPPGRDRLLAAGEGQRQEDAAGLADQVGGEALHDRTVSKVGWWLGAPWDSWDQGVSLAP